MRFAAPLFWLLLLAVLAALWRAILLEKARRPTLTFPGPLLSSDKSTRPLATRSLAWLARWLSLALTGGALVLIVAGLARPQKTRSRLQGLGRGIDIMLVTDVSLSMNALDFDPISRLDAAKDTALRFLRGRVQDRIGLVVFGGAALLACPLTHDYGALSERLGALEGGMTHVDGTAIGDGIVSGVNHLKASDAKSKIMILLTDGRSNSGLIDPITAAKTAAAYGIKVYAIGTAIKGESILPVDDPQRGRVMVRIQDDLDEETLAEVARIGGGNYWRATSLKELRSIYAEIDRLEKSAVKLPEIVSHDDLYAFPTAAAALLLLLEAALSGTLLMRWP